MIVNTYKEVTQWDVEYKQPNHEYAFNEKGQMVAYRKFGEGDWLILKTPSKQFNKARRKFISSGKIELTC